MTREVNVLEFEPIVGRRITATPDALDSAAWPPDTRVVRIAPDDVFLIGEGEVVLVDDHAIIDHEAGFSGAWVPISAMNEWLERFSIWSLAPEGELAQGMAAHLPIKTIVDGDQVLVLIASVIAHELQERLS